MNVERIFARNTHKGNRFNFRVENYQSSKYKNSPCFKDSAIWDQLPLDVIQTPIMCEFKAKIRKMFSPFDELLS